MKVKIEGHIAAWHFGDPDRKLDDFDFFTGPEKDTDNLCAIAPYTIEVDVDLPESDKLTQRIVQALRKQRDAIYVNAAEQAERVETKIAQLLALTNEVQS